MNLSKSELFEFIRLREEETVLKTLGIRLEYDAHQERVLAVVDVDDRLFQPGGIVHGGVYVVMAETAASVTAALAVDLTKVFVVGMEINANHVRPVSSAQLRASALPVHQGQSSHVYQTEVRNNEGRLVSVGRCTIAVRERPAWAE